MGIFLHADIARPQMLRHLPDIFASSVVAHVNVDFCRVRVLQKGAGIHGFIQKFLRFVVGRDQHVHVRKAFRLCLLRKRDLKGRGPHPADHQLCCAGQGHRLRQDKGASGCHRNDAFLQGQGKKDPPEQIDPGTYNGSQENAISLFIVHCFPPRKNADNTCRLSRTGRK